MESHGIGSIKKIFGRQREPYGFLTIHHPEELRGDEAVFYLKDVIGSEEERRLLQGGLMVRFVFTRKPVDRMKAPCPFKAIQVRPQDPMRYSGTVAKTTSGGSLVVFLEILFRQVKVHQNNQSLDAGDRCTVSIPWKEMARALRENREPVGTLVAIDKKFNSFFSSQPQSYENTCQRCQVHYWDRNSSKGYSGSHLQNFNNYSSSIFGNLDGSIWSEKPSSDKRKHEISAAAEPWDAEWYLQTIRMAEMVLSGNGTKM